jgi:GDP-4-dehydro-6-deoxy-D-mannose reductase
MKALITGIDGFVAPHLNSLLKNKGIETVTTYNSAETAPRESIHMDITNETEVTEVIKTTSPDMIFHLAGFSSVAKSFENPALCMKINVDGTKNILDAVRLLGLKTKILVVGSAEVYGKPVLVPITENHPLSANTPYGESRIKQEALCDEYVTKYDLFVVVSRGFNHTGPGQIDTFAIPSFAKQITLIEQGKQTELKVGNLNAIRDFSDVRDVVNAYYLILKKGKKGEKYNVCSGNQQSMKNILNVLINKAKKKIMVTEDSNRMRPSDIPILVGDNTKLRETTGWKPQIKLEQTMSDVLEFWRKKI